MFLEMGTTEENFQQAAKQEAAKQEAVKQEAAKQEAAKAFIVELRGCRNKFRSIFLKNC